MRAAWAGISVYRTYALPYGVVGGYSEANVTYEVDWSKAPDGSFREDKPYRDVVETYLYRLSRGDIEEIGEMVDPGAQGDTGDLVAGWVKSYRAHALDDVKAFVYGSGDRGDEAAIDRTYGDSGKTQTLLLEADFGDATDAGIAEELGWASDTVWWIEATDPDPGQMRVWRETD